MWKGRWSNLQITPPEEETEEIRGKCDLFIEQYQEVEE